MKFAKGHNSVKNVGGVMVLVFCMSFDDALYLCMKIFSFVLKLWSIHDFHWKNFKEA